MPRQLRQQCCNIFEAILRCQEHGNKYEADIDPRSSLPVSDVYPGTPEKVELMRRRVEEGRELFVEGDGADRLT